MLDIRDFDGQPKILEYGLSDISELVVFCFDSLKCQGWIQSVEMTFRDGHGSGGVAKYNSIWAEMTHKVTVTYSDLSEVSGKSVGESPLLSTLIRVLIDGTCHEIIPENQLDLRRFEGFIPGFTY